MLTQIYPTHAVVCNDAIFAEKFNGDIDNISMNSSCISSHKAEELYNGGAKFETLIFIDHSEKNINIEKDSSQVVEHLQLTDYDLTLKEVKSILQSELFKGGMG